MSQVNSIFVICDIFSLIFSFDSNSWILHPGLESILIFETFYIFIETIMNQPQPSFNISK